jgi:hypothetical protein
MNLDTLAALFGPGPMTWDRVALDPGALLDACRDQEVSGLIYHHVRDTPAFASWPRVVRDALADASRAAAARELLVQREIGRVLDALDAHGVHPLLLKGTALAYTVYPHPSLRSRSDTDLLIDGGDIETVQHALTTLGYTRSLLCDGDLLFRQFEWAREDEFGVVHALDVHWAISTQAAFARVLTYDEMAARAVEAAALGGNARVPATMHALLLALIHPAMHHQNQRRLLWGYDVQLLARRLDSRAVQELVDHAIARGVAEVCAHGLRTAQGWFGAAVPREALDRLAAAPLSGQPSAAYLAPARTWKDDTVANLRGLPRWRDRLRLFREIAAPSPAYMLQAYGVGGSGLGRALLPALYVHRGVRGLWRVISGRK